MRRLSRRARRRPAGWKPPLIEAVRQGSECDGLVVPGDRLLELNGAVPLDILDYMEACAEERVSLRLLRGDREISRTLRKGPGVPLGLVFAEPVFDGVRTCRNRCGFCFVDQMPPGLRPSLYLKDDDYRLSFYYGNFVTLNNLSRGDLERIKRMRIAPLYVSLHSTRPELRESMMGSGAAAGLAALKELLSRGLEVHLQVVVCPGINDGEELRRTLRDVLSGYPAASLGAVPVSLSTRPLPPGLRPHDRGTARGALEIVEEYQRLAMREHGRRMFFASDEFYLLAGEDLPPQEEYEGYPQLENGVGMARKLIEEARGESGKAGTAGGIGIITGVAGAGAVEAALRAAGMSGVETVTARSGLFGAPVTVTALLSGRDIISALQRAAPASRELLFPDSMLRDGRFLDDLTPRDVEIQTGYRLRAVEVRGDSLVRALRMGEEDD